MKSGLYIRVPTDDPADAERIKNYLAEAGWTSDEATLENVLNDHLYHLSRISSKLDNLGQLRHLFRVRQIISAKFGEKMTPESLAQDLERMQGRKVDGQSK